MIERLWSPIGPMPLTAQGTTGGVLEVASSCGLRVKMLAGLTDPALPPIQVEIKRVPSKTTIEVGRVDQSILDRLDVSAYGVTSSFFVLEQPKTIVPLQESQKAVYEHEPVCAERSLLVDNCGYPYTAGNPLPVQVINVTKRIAIGFLVSDWVANQMVCIRDGVPTIPGEIGPHNMPLGTYLTATVWRFIGPGYMKEVGLTIIQHPLTGDMTIIKSELPASFSGVVFIDGY